MFSPTTQTQTQADGPGDAHAHAHSHAASRLTPRAFVAQPQSPAKPRALFANTAKTSALLMNNDESERLLNEGLAIVQEAFDRRTAVLQGELLEWRQNSLAQREQIINLENENKSLNQKLNELESIVQAQRTDLLTLSDSKNLITEKYNILKKSAAQLDSFRKSIVSMVEYGPAMASALNAMDLNQSFNLTNEHSETPLSSTTPAALANSARYSPTSRQFSMNSNPARSSPQNAIPSSYTESIPYHGSHSSHSANGVPTSPRRLINPIVGGASGGNSGDYQRMPSRNTFNNNNTNVSYLEGPSFLNANDLKSFELTSQTLDYSLAFPDRHTHMNSAHLASNAPRQATNNSDLSFIGLKQTEEPEQQPQTVQHENHSYEAEQEELQNYRQPQQQPQHQQQQQQQGQTDVSLALPPKLQPGNSNNLKLSSLSTPNLSQLGSGKGSRNNSQQQHQTGSFAGSKMAGNQIQKTLDRVNRRTTETENDSSSSTPTPLTTSGNPTNSTTTASMAATTKSRNIPSNQKQQQSFSSSSSSSEATRTPTADAGGAAVDAPTLYKQIRDALSQPEFEAFAGYVAGFNSGSLTADEAVKNIGRIVKDRQLFGRMRNLIYTALAESSRGGGST